MSVHELPLQEAEWNWEGISSANESSHIVTNCQKSPRLRELTASWIGLIDVQSGNNSPSSTSVLLAQYFILNSRLGSSADPFHLRPFPFLPEWFYGMSDHLMISVLNGCICHCVRLSLLLVGFRTHFKSLHFHSFHFISQVTTFLTQTPLFRFVMDMLR